MLKLLKEVCYILVRIYFSNLLRVFSNVFFQDLLLNWPFLYMLIPATVQIWDRRLSFLFLSHLCPAACGKIFECSRNISLILLDTLLKLIILFCYYQINLFNFMFIQIMKYYYVIYPKNRNVIKGKNKISSGSTRQRASRWDIDISPVLLFVIQNRL